MRKRCIVIKSKSEPSYRKVEPTDRRFLDYRSACEYFSVGRSTLDKIADEAEAIVRFGRMKRYDRERLISYLDELTKKE